jgi:L-seryl-tRNA(Ser) seleniumtransferase
MTASDKSVRGYERFQSSRLRALPSVTAILNTAVAAKLVQRFGRTASTEAVRETIDHAREAMKAGASAPDAQELAPQASVRLDQRDRSSLRPLFNLTGTVLHTNLGRATLL